MHIRSILNRQLVPLEAFDGTVRLYEGLLAQSARLRFEYPEKGLRIAQVAQILVVGGDPLPLEPFEATDMTVLVDDINGYAEWLPSVGAEIVRPVGRTPSGKNMLVRLPDAALVEYVEHDRPDPADDVLTKYTAAAQPEN